MAATEKRVNIVKIGGFLYFFLLERKPKTS